MVTVAVTAVFINRPSGESDFPVFRESPNKSGSLQTKEEFMSHESTNPYPPSHPWYYVLGGVIPGPREIHGQVIASGYQGYLKSDISKAASKQEPKRSITLRDLRGNARSSLFSDLSRYRQCARELNLHRQNHGYTQSECLDIHVSISLKHNHIYNGFAHLIRLEELLTEQPELFSLAESPLQTGGARGR